MNGAASLGGGRCLLPAFGEQLGDRLRDLDRLFVEIADGDAVSGAVETIGTQRGPGERPHARDAVEVEQPLDVLGPPRRWRGRVVGKLDDEVDAAIRAVRNRTLRR